MAHHNDLGAKGEATAVDFLQKKGHCVLAQNYRYKHAEIDIISSFEGFLVFTEVKARSTAVFGFPEEAISEKKQEKLMEGALHYIEENDVDIPYRFDVVAIIFSGAKPQIHHIEDAF